MKTPFVFGRLATDENFTDRVEETRHLIQNFSSLINTIIISPRRWGKSSLVHRASIEAKKMDPKLRICHIDLFNVRSEAHFYQILIESVLKATSSKFEEALTATAEFLRRIVPRIVFSAEPAPGYNVQLDWDRVRDNVDEILDLAENIAIKKGVKIVICIDEFQNISYFSDSEYLQKRLRSHWQRHQHVAYCFFGSKRHMMLEVFAESSKPFYKFGDLIFLQKIEGPIMSEFIRRRFSETGKSISKEASQLIVDLVDDHPYYIQQLAQLSWLRCEKVCDMNTVKEAHSTLIEQLSLLFQNLTESLTNTQVRYLHALIDQERAISSSKGLNKYEFTSATSVSRAKKALIEKDIIEAIGKHPNIQDPAYAYWLKHTYFG